MKIGYVTIISLFLVFAVISGNAYSIVQIKEKKMDENQLILDDINFLLDNANLDIIRPRSSIPVFVERNGSFRVDFNSNIFENIYLYMSTSYEPIEDRILLDVESFEKENDGWYAIVKVPFETPVELYNLTLIILKDDKYYSTSRPRAVSIVDSFDDNFNFVHITDFHVGDPRGFAESIRETIGYKSVRRCIYEINLLNPDFVIISGDLVFGQLYPFEYRREYKKCYDMIQMFDVPTFLAPGNHDGYRRLGEDGLEIWQEYFGPLYYSFDYGNYHFLSINSFDWPAEQRWTISFLSFNWGGGVGNRQIGWIEQDLKTNDANLTFMFMHHNPLWDTINDNFLGLHYKNQDILLEIIDDYNVDMVLAGHTHIDNITIKNDTIFVTTTTPESEIRVDDGYWGYRLIEIEDGKIKKYNYKEPRFSIPSYKFKVEYNSKYSATVINDLEMDIEVLLKFTVPKRPYIIENAVIQYIREDGILREYYLIVNVAKESNLEANLNYIN